MRQTGRVVAVEAYTVGSVATAAAAEGAESVLVADPGAFDEHGGTVRIVTDDAEHVMAYTAVDDDTGALTLTAGLPGAVAEDDPVRVEPLATERTAFVVLEDSASPPVLALVPHTLRLLVAEGLRGDAEAEAVYVEEYEPGSWAVVDVLGAEPTLSIGSDPLIRPGGFPRVKALRTNMFVGNATDRVIGFSVDQVTVDTDAFRLGVDDESQFRLPFAGQYDVRLALRWPSDGATTSFRRIWAEVSADEGATWTSGRDIGLADDRSAAGNSIPTAQSFAPPPPTFDAGDWIRFLCRHNSGAALTAEAVSVSIMYLGPVAA